MIPLVVFPSQLASGGTSTMSDIMFLAKKEYDEKLRKDTNSLSAIGDLVILTANTGKDMYIGRAKVNFHGNSTSQASSVSHVDLKINGTTVESAKYFGPTGFGAGGDYAFDYEFKNIGHKVTTGQIIKLEVIAIDSQVDVTGFIECWEEDTNADPTI